MRRFDVAARRTLAARLKVSVTLIARVDPPRAVKETRDFTSTLPFFASALVRGAVRVTLTVYVPALLTVLDRLFSPGPAITIRPGSDTRTLMLAFGPRTVLEPITLGAVTDVRLVRVSFPAPWKTTDAAGEAGVVADGAP